VYGCQPAGSTHLIRPRTSSDIAWPFELSAGWKRARDRSKRQVAASSADDPLLAATLQI
jgi:hypothetical protein